MNLNWYDPLDVPYTLNWKLESDQKPVVQKQLFVELNPDKKNSI